MICFISNCKIIHDAIEVDKFGLIPQKLKTKVTSTQYISAYYAIFMSTD